MPLCYFCAPPCRYQKFYEQKSTNKLMNIVQNPKTIADRDIAGRTVIFMFQVQLYFGVLLS